MKTLFCSNKKLKKVLYLWMITETMSHCGVLIHNLFDSFTNNPISIIIYHNSNFFKQNTYLHYVHYILNIIYYHGTEGLLS
jgi:hypothetical protein